jgi:hypothetical protein
MRARSVAALLAAMGSVCAFALWAQQQRHEAHIREFVPAVICDVPSGQPDLRMPE